MFFQCEMKSLENLSFEDKLKMNNWKRIFRDILEYKFNMEFINEIWKMGLKINIDLFLKCENYLSCKYIFGK